MIDKLQELWNKFLYKLMFKNYKECDKKVVKAKKKIRQAMKELGITKKDVDNTGYTRRLWDKGIKDKKYFVD